MKQELKESILEQLSRMNGQVGFYYKNLISSETLTYHENEQFRAASVVKLPLLAGMMLMREQGRTSFDELITVHPDQMHPDTSGVLPFMTGDKNGDVTLDINTLYKFMIVISDTTATNALYHHYGNDTVIAVLRELGLKGTQFNREYYDDVRESQGIQNYFVPAELGELLEKMFRRTLVSAKASEEMEDILLYQQINHKMAVACPWAIPLRTRRVKKRIKRTTSVSSIPASRSWPALPPINRIFPPMRTSSGKQRLRSRSISILS